MMMLATAMAAAAADALVVVGSGGGAGRLLLRCCRRRGGSGRQQQRRRLLLLPLSSSSLAERRTSTTIVDNGGGAAVAPSSLSRCRQPPASSAAGIMLSSSGTIRRIRGTSPITIRRITAAQAARTTITTATARTTAVQQQQRRRARTVSSSCYYSATAFDIPVPHNNNRYRRRRHQPQQQLLHQRQQQRQQRYLSSSSPPPPSVPPPPPSRRGLFSIPELRRPSDFLSLAAEAVSECDRLRSSLSSSRADIATAAQARDLLRNLDGISKTVCNVIDAAELARSVCANKEWRESAHRAFSVLADYIAQLNGDRALYDALIRVRTYYYSQSGGDDDDDDESSSLLSEEEARFVNLLQAEFERDGIHLSDGDRERVRAIQNQVTELEGMFTNNLVTKGGRKTFWADARAVQDVLPEHVLTAYGMDPTKTRSQSPSLSSASAGGGKEQMELIGDVQVLQSLLKYSPDPDLRRQVYVESTTLVPDNLAVLDALVDRRRELASALGYESYAQRFLLDKMAGSQQVVSDFLSRLRKTTEPAYRREMEILAAAKMQVEGGGSGGGVEPWDIAFYVGLLKARGDGGFDASSVSQYLTLDRSLESMQLLVRKLFGIEMEEVKMSDDERWDIAHDDEGHSANEHGVRRFDFIDTDRGTALGTMYFDLHPRPGKYGHAAHFTIRCGCRITHSDGETTEESDPKFQLPIVALVCNFSSPTSSDGSSSAGAAVHMSHAEVETLFHEFGHGLHSLLSRTEFQHMSGTRSAMDFVETPSHLMENFVWDPEFLKILAVNDQTGEVLPEDTIHKLRRSRYEFYAIERMNQIIYATFDQKLFGKPDPSGVSTSELFAGIHRDFGVPYAENTHWYTRFGHLVTYGGGYYGYLYAQVFAADIWKSLFEGNSLSRNAGDQLWHKMLIHGGAKDPRHILADLLGQPPP